VHDWKSCGRVNCLVGSNPTLSVYQPRCARHGTLSDRHARTQFAGPCVVGTARHACAGTFAAPQPSAPHSCHRGGRCGATRRSEVAVAGTAAPRRQASRLAARPLTYGSGRLVVSPASKRRQATAQPPHQLCANRPSRQRRRVAPRRCFCLDGAARYACFRSSPPLALVVHSGGQSPASAGGKAASAWRRMRSSCRRRRTHRLGTRGAARPAKRRPAPPA
jgi:hypothetical protein